MIPIFFLKSVGPKYPKEIIIFEDQPTAVMWKSFSVIAISVSLPLSSMSFSIGADLNNAHPLRIPLEKKLFVRGGDGIFNFTAAQLSHQHTLR
jgi:hypothetical protein